MKLLDKKKEYINKKDITKYKIPVDKNFLKMFKDDDIFEITKPESLDKKKTNIEIVDTDIFSIGTDGGNKPIKPINLDKKETKKLEWEKEFDKVLNDYNCVIEASEEVYQDGRKVVKQFIKQLLTQQRTELLEEIKNHTFVIPQGHTTRGFKLDDKDLDFIKKL